MDSHRRPLVPKPLNHSWKEVMKNKIVFAGVLFVGFSVLVLGIQNIGTAQVDISLFRGAGHVGTVTELPFRYQILKKENGRQTKRIETNRDLFAVPKFYGEPFTVTTVGDKSIIWYRASDGVVRNVVIEQGDMLIETSVQAGTRRTQ